LNGEVFGACIKAISVVTCGKSVTVGIWLVTESYEVVYQREWPTNLWFKRTIIDG